MSDSVYSTIAQGYNPLTQLSNLTNLQMRQAQLAQQRFETQQQKLQPAYASMMGLVPLGNNVTHDQVAAALADSARIGGDISGLTDNLNAAMASGDPNYLSKFVRQNALRYVPPFEALQALGGPESVQTGAGAQFGMVGGRLSPQPGVFQRTSFVPQGLSPMQAVTPLDIRMSDGSVVQKLPAEVPGFLGQNPGASVVGPSAGGPVPAGGGSVPGFGTGRYPTPTTTTTPTPAPQAAPPRLTVGPPPQPVPGVSPPLGAGEAALGSVGLANAMGTSAGASPQRQAILSDMESSLSGVSALNTGPGSDWAHAWSAVVNRLPDNLSTLLPGMTREQVASYEGFGKMAEQLRQLQSQQIAGALTNDKFASALASNPHLALSTLGNMGMIHILQGNEDAITAKNNAWQQALAQGWQPKDFMAWQAQYNQTPSADPRIYWLPHMSLPERQKFVAGMTPDQKRRLATNYEAAGGG